MSKSNDLIRSEWSGSTGNNRAVHDLLLYLFFYTFGEYLEQIEVCHYIVELAVERLDSSNWDGTCSLVLKVFHWKLNGRMIFIHLKFIFQIILLVNSVAIFGDSEVMDVKRSLRIVLWKNACVSWEKTFKSI